MKTIFGFLVAALLVAGLAFTDASPAKAQKVTIEVSLAPPDVGLCRCHTAGDNHCMGGNLISLRARCGSAKGCAAGGPC